jgi:TolB-like protein/Tfp pilus assembly protein PilF
MTSLLPGYKYDIFISYRQKDNKGDRWVSEFVGALKTELESTFKEEVSVYFDINPHDGLLETHDVDDSLKEKLKCLIFIPIISRTYCDPKSFAWQHEFRAFVEQASGDQFGLKVKLPNGNVASRVLPVRTHDLDCDDIKLCESIMGGMLRGVDFIYKESGVNRPITLMDNEEKNLNKTNYRNQINKIANAIKEIIVGLKTYSFFPGNDHKEVLSNKYIPDFQEKSIAVLPFVDMSPEKDLDYFCDGMAEEIINALAHNENLKVISRTSAFAFKDKNEDVREIGKRLGVETLLEGSIRKSGNRIRITAQLINVNDGSHIWIDRYDREIKDVFATQDEISLAIMDNLKVKLLGEKKTMIAKLHSEIIEAYKLYLKGTYYWQMLTAEGYNKAAECFQQALQKDPNYALAYTGLSYVTAYSTGWGNLPPNKGFPKIIEYINKALEIDNTLAEAYSGLAGINLYYYWNWKEAEKNYKYALQINPNSSQIHLDYSNFLTFNRRHEEAINEAKRAQELDPLSIYINTYTGFAFDYAGQYDRAIEEYRKTLAINPNYFITHYHLGRAYSGKSMIREAISEYEKAVEISNGTPLPISVLAGGYYLIGKKDQADKLFEDLLKRAETEYVPATTIYLIYRIRKEEEMALNWLRRACDEHDILLPWFRAHPFLIPEGSSYMKLLEEMGRGF